jgi:hypothetical protein
MDSREGLFVLHDGKKPRPRIPKYDVDAVSWILGVFVFF